MIARRKDSSTALPKTTYWFRVRATSDSLDSSYSNVATITTPHMAEAIQLRRFERGG